MITKCLQDLLDRLTQTMKDMPEDILRNCNVSWQRTSCIYILQFDSTGTKFELISFAFMCIIRFAKEAREEMQAICDADETSKDWVGWVFHPCLMSRFPWLLGK